MGLHSGKEVMGSNLHLRGLLWEIYLVLCPMTTVQAVDDGIDLANTSKYMKIIFFFHTDTHYIYICFFFL